MKERLVKMHALPTPSRTESPQPQHPLPEVAQGQGMTHQVDRYFFQESLLNMNLQDPLPRLDTPMHGDHPVTPEVGQYDSQDLDDQEEDLTSQADFDSEEEYTNVTGPRGGLCPTSRTAGETAPCVGRGCMPNAIFIKEAWRKAGSWPSPCSGKLTEMTASHTAIGEQKLKPP